MDNIRREAGQACGKLVEKHNRRGLDGLPDGNEGYFERCPCLFVSEIKRLDMRAQRSLQRIHGICRAVDNPARFFCVLPKEREGAREPSYFGEHLIHDFYVAIRRRHKIIKGPEKAPRGSENCPHCIEGASDRRQGIHRLLGRPEYRIEDSAQGRRGLRRVEADIGHGGYRAGHFSHGYAELRGDREDTPNCSGEFLRLDVAFPDGGDKGIRRLPG